MAGGARHRAGATRQRAGPRREENRAAGAHRAAPARSGFESTRDLASYIIGVLLIGHEVFIERDPSWPVMIVGMALVGLPVALGGSSSAPKPASPPGEGR